MSSYFDEHNCDPLPDGQGPDELLHLARLLIDTGAWMEDEFSALFGEQAPPPVSKTFLESGVKVTAYEASKDCPICLKSSPPGEPLTELPCKHCYHGQCIETWFEKTNSCPLCRTEYPTDDPDYEEIRKQKMRQETRRLELETLHDSMFG